MVWRIFITYLILLLLAKEGIIHNKAQFIILLIIGIILALLEVDEEVKVICKKE